jgi:hypothetical protein
MVTSLCATSSLLDNLDTYEEHETIHVRNRLTLGTNNSRRLLQTINNMADNSHLSPHRICWYVLS